MLYISAHRINTMTSSSAGVQKRPAIPTGLTAWDPELACPGYTLYCHMRGEKRIHLLDMQGERVKSWDISLSPHYGELLPNGNLLFIGNTPDAKKHPMVQAFKLVELTWDGEKVWEFDELNIHHDFARLPNGNTLVLGREPIPPEIVKKVKGGVPGTERDGVMMGDLYAEVTPEGDIVWEWHCHEHLDYEDDVICPLCTRHEWVHANSCEPLPGGDVLTTFRLTHTVAIIDRESGDFKWKWGKDELGHPHDPTFLPNGNIQIFDNGMHIQGMPRSRIVEVNPSTNEIEWCYQGKRLMEFFSPHISGAQRLWNGNTLVCEGYRGRLFEVTRDKEVVWEFYNPDFVVDDRMDKKNPSLSSMVFRARRYPEDFPAFEGKGLPPAA